MGFTPMPDGLLAVMMVFGAMPVIITLTLVLVAPDSVERTRMDRERD